MFRNTTAHANADALSQLPLPEEPAKVISEPELVLLAEHLADSPVTANDSRSWTQRDTKLSRVLYYVRHGWPTEGDTNLEPYSSRRLELSHFEGCVLWGSRVVVPPPGRQAVLQELHEGHPGITRMKALSRMYVWWPGISSDIEKSVRQCHECQEMQSTPPVAPLNPWKWPTRPWARLHLDFLGPFEGKNILVVIDAHSKWIEAVCTPSTSSASVIEVIRTLFAQFGVPEMVVTDNGTGFVSTVSKQNLGQSGRHSPSGPFLQPLLHYLNSPLRKAIRGWAIRCGSRVLDPIALQKLFKLTGYLLKRLPAHHQPSCYWPRSRLDLLRPNTAERVEEKQQQQKAQHDRKALPRTFRVGDTVFMKNFGAGRRWLPGQVVEMSGPVSFHVLLEDGRCKRCHQDQLRSRVVDDGEPDASQGELDSSFPITSPSSSAEVPPIPRSTEPCQPTRSSLSTDQPESHATVQPTKTTAQRYPQRHRKPREWFEPGAS